MQYYPNDFSRKARANVIAAKVKAYRVVENPGGVSYKQVPGILEHWETWVVFQCIMTVFATFAHECCELGRSGVWGADQVEEEAQNGLQAIVIEATTQKFEQAKFHLPSMLSNGTIRPEIHSIFSETPEWKNYENELEALTNLLLEEHHPASPPPERPKNNPSDGPRPELLKGETVNKAIAATALGVSRRTLDRYVASGLLRPIGAFRRRRFSTKDLMSFINQQK